MSFELDLNLKEIPVGWLSLANKLQENPSDFTKWQQFISISETVPTYNNKYSNPVSKTSPSINKKLLLIAYENVLVQFPYLEQYWCNFAEWHFKLGDTASAVDVYQRALTIMPKSIVIWKNYLKFSEKTLLTYEKLVPVFEESRKAIGHHFYSHIIYDHYLKFLKFHERTKEYHYLIRRIIEIPMYYYSKYFREFLNLIEAANLETIKYLITKDDLMKLYNHKWPDLIDRPPTKKQKLESETTIKSNFNELKVDLKKRYMDQFITTQYHTFQIWQFEKKIPQPYFNPNTELTRQELLNWKMYLEYLETVNLRAPAPNSSASGVKVDKSIISKINYEAVLLAYHRCLIVTAQYPTFYMKLSNFHVNLNEIELAIDVLQRGIWMCPLTTSVKLRIRLVDLLVLKGDIEEAKSVSIELCMVYPELVEGWLKLLQIEQLLGNGNNLLKIVEAKLDDVLNTQFETQFDLLLIESLNYSVIKPLPMLKLLQKYETKKKGVRYWKAYLDYYYLYYQDKEKLKSVKKLALKMMDKDVGEKLVARYAEEGKEEEYF